MQKLLIATHNPAKLGELQTLLAELPLKLFTLPDVGISEDVEEDGQTYEENSQKKALFYAQKSGLPAVSDDGGLEIVALGGAPGIHSKRWIGDDATEDDLVAHLHNVSRDLPEDNRDAYFKTVISLALPDGKVWSVGGEIHGIIAKESSMKKKTGFPYRSFFYLPELKKYYFETELTPEEMQQYNHRVKAVEKLKVILKRELSVL